MRGTSHTPAAFLRFLNGVEAMEGITFLSDNDMTAIEGMKGLELLDLRNTQITDARVVHLKGMTKLRSRNNYLARTKSMEQRMSSQIHASIERS